MITGSSKSRTVDQRVLPNGSTMTLETVTQGVHRFHLGGNLGRLFAAFLPEGARAATGLRVFTRTDVGPEVPVAWFTMRSRGASSRPELPYKWTLIDDDGCETQLIGPWLEEVKPGQAVGSFPLPILPRAGRRIGIRIYALQINAAARPVTEFWLPVVQRRPAASWKPRPLPITTRDGDVEYTLRRFVSGAALLSPDRAPYFKDLTEAASHLEIAVNRRSGPATDWAPVTFILEDAMGNRIDAGAYSNPRRTGNLTRLSYRENLFREEQTWRVRVEVARTRNAAFRPEEVVTLRAVPTPQRNGMASNDWSVNPVRRLVNGGELECRGAEWDSMGPPYANLQVSLVGRPLAGTRVTLLKVIDDSGRSLPLPEQPRIVEFNSANPKQVDYSFPLEIRKPMKSVEVTLAVQRTHTVEFIASPSPPPVKAASAWWLKR